MLGLLLIKWVTGMKPGSNPVEDHPQLSHNRHPVNGALVGAGSQSLGLFIHYLFPKFNLPEFFFLVSISFVVFVGF
jgi:hypothetical protein